MNGFADERRNTGSSIGADAQQHLAVDVRDARGDVMDRLDARTAPHRDRRYPGQLPEHDGDRAFACEVPPPRSEPHRFRR